MLSGNRLGNADAAVFIMVVKVCPCILRICLNFHDISILGLC